ncbi:thioredoxin [Hymenobacter terricola]|uniref:thioredoxin n=1 Tax=Hymenobacter terricola TaxID=2819236 RepID=UPI001B304464|nr:thioredoxin [Hymenobacter terricola]
MLAPVPAAFQPAATTPAAEAAVLLVLLPRALPGTRPGRPATLAALGVLQQQLGAAIRVLTIDEASHPSVVSSFEPTELPAWVLMQRGIELWRQQGLPEGETTVALLLSKIRPVIATG